MADEAQAESGEAPKKSKLMFFIILGVLLIAAVVGGFFYYTKFMATPPPQDGDGETKPEASKAAVVGHMYTLQPFVVNLSDPKGKRYLKTRIAIELDNEAQEEKIIKILPKIRDMVIMLLTSLTFEEVMTPEGKLRIRDELFERFNQTIRPDRLKSIYFTEFVIQ
jgi:flagellar protein FliL